MSSTKMTTRAARSAMIKVMREVAKLPNAEPIAIFIGCSIDEWANQIRPQNYKNVGRKIGSKSIGKNKAGSGRPINPTSGRQQTLKARNLRIKAMGFLKRGRPSDIVTTYVAAKMNKCV